MTRFDETLSIVEDLLRARFGHIPNATVIRDAFGTVTVILPSAIAGTSDRRRLSQELHTRLGAFSPGERTVLVKESDLIDRDILDSVDAVRLDSGLRLVDRLLTNQDWLRDPLEPKVKTRLATAFSVKGGVGRTTALAILAWSLARAGERVVVVDLDLEAPGIGAAMLPELPEYGLIDWLIESLVGQADPSLLDRCINRSPLCEDTAGEVFVLPAFGASTKEYVAKLGRVYMPTTSASLEFTGIAERLHSMLQQISELERRIGTCLLDSRAGLHDLGAAVVTRLSAEVFMFARDDRQTWEAYRRLFRHLRNGRSIGNEERDLRWRLKMVAAQADPGQAAQERWIDQCYSIWTDELYDEETTAGDTRALTFARDEESAPHFPLFIDFDDRVRSYDLLNRENWPRFEVVESTFGNFLRGAAERLSPQSED